MARKRLQSDPPQFNLRLEAPLRRALQAKADANRRSLTAEIIQRLEDSLAFEESDEAREEPPPVAKAKEEPDGTAPMRALAETVAALEARLATLEKKG